MNNQAFRLFTMKFPAGNFVVELHQDPEKGTPWRVSVYKKALWFKKRISSDWFLDEKQAQNYADQVARYLQSNDVADYLRKRQPGWTLQAPLH